MDLITELNYTIEYIEDHLDEDIILEDIASITSYSPYHFKRIFNYISGISLSEYIRRRRLSVAIFDLQNGEKVIDVAMKYGYVSADSFARAFTKQHGITPSQSKSQTISMELYPPMNFKLTVDGTKGLSCRIEKKEAFSMFGVDTLLNKDIKTMQLQMVQFVQNCKANEYYSKMNEIFGYNHDMVLHRAFQNIDDKHISYMICQYMKHGVYVPDYFKRFYVPASQWAIFRSEEEEMENLWARIYSEWLPNAGYEILNGIAFEVYFGSERKGNVRGEIMIPIQEKKSQIYKISNQKRRHYKKEECTLSEKYHIEKFIYNDSWNKELGELYKAVSKKHPGGIYWNCNPGSNEGKHVFLCLDNENHVIGKGHAMIFEKQEDDAPGYAEHRIFIHYRVLPEYEKDEEALDLLYESTYQCARELRKQLSNRVCQVCFGNLAFEEVYNQHIEKKEWPEYGSVYHLSAKTKEVVSNISEIDEVIFREFSLESEEIIHQLVLNDQICFRDTISSVDNYLDIANSNYIAYGAFIKSREEKETLVGSVVAELEENQLPEIISVMVLPEYRRKYIASTMIQYVLGNLHKKGYERTWLVTHCVNNEAIEMYQKKGFKIYAHEKRYMKYI
jgi:AraC family transcriptional regulator